MMRFTLSQMNKQFYLLLICLFLQTLSFAQYGVNDLPNPKQQGQDYFVSNPDGILNTYTVNELDSLAKAIEQQSSAEVAVVVVKDFKGEDDFEFALELFNTWGIGKKENDNGLLLLIASDRRVYRFITGYGIEGILPDVVLKHVGEEYMVPAFKQNDYNGGVLQAMRVIHRALLSPKAAGELKAQVKKESFFYRYQSVLISSVMVLLLMLAALRWIGYIAERKIVAKKQKTKVGENGTSLLGGCGCLLITVFLSIFALWFLGMDPKSLFQMKWVPWYIAFMGSIAIAVKYGKTEEYIKKAFWDEKNRIEALTDFHKRTWLSLLLSPLLLIGLFIFLKRKKKSSLRFIPPSEAGNWKRLDRDTLKKKTDLLDAGQLKEEQELSRSYELWENTANGKIKAVGWPGIRAKNFSACPSCHYHTFKKPHVKTIKAATYSDSGIGERIQQCAFCKHEVSLGKVTIARKQNSSSSSAGSGGSSGGGSSSGSFGGGSSGGGGAGGRW